MIVWNGQLVLKKNSFRWQDKEGYLLIRMDNSPHSPDMPNAPHHVHKEEDVVESLLETPEILSFLDEIKKRNRDKTYYMPSEKTNSLSPPYIP